jgi:hypothetical protein
MLLCFFVSAVRGFGPKNPNITKDCEFVKTLYFKGFSLIATRVERRGPGKTPSLLYGFKPSNFQENCRWRLDDGDFRHRHPSRGSNRRCKAARRNAYHLRHQRGPDLGGFSAVLGLLGQFAGIYNALGAK